MGKRFRNHIVLFLNKVANVILDFDAVTPLIIPAHAGNRQYIPNHDFSTCFGDCRRLQCRGIHR